MRLVGVVLECAGCFKAYVHDIAGEFQSRDLLPHFPLSLLGTLEEDFGVVDWKGGRACEKVPLDSALWATELRHLHVIDADEPHAFYVHSSVEACLCTTLPGVTRHFE